MSPHSIHDADPQQRIRELEAEVDALRNSEARYRGIIENMELGMMEVDAQECVVRAHPRFCEMVGYTEEELLGRKASDVLLDEEARAGMDAVTAARNAGDSGLYETPVRTKFGELRWLLISGVPVFDTEGNVIGSMGIHYDITERKRDEERMRVALEEAEVARRTEREFLARMSHEVRTPMTAILGMCRLLGETPLNPEQKALWSAMKDGGEVLQRLLDGVLNLTRLDAGRMEVRKEAIDLGSLVMSVTAPFRPALAQKGVSCQLDLAESLPHVLLDGALFTQILLNLLGNAVKFTDSGSIVVGVDVTGDEGASRLNMTVSDSGIGIPDDEVEHVFTRFKQASNREYRHLGSGLGLSIVKDIVDLLEGNVSVESQLGSGTRFVVELPVQIIDPPHPEGAPTDLAAFEGDVLVAEDNEVNAFLLKSLLENWGATVTVVSNGEEAVQAWRQGQFNVICMDVQMPLRDGLWATRTIRAEEQGRIPILGLSAFAFDADRQASLDAGMDAYLTKPFKPEELRAALGRLLA